MPKNSFLSMLTKSNATSPFNMAVKTSTPMVANQSKLPPNQSTVNGPRYAAPPIAPATPPSTSAKNSYIESQMPKPAPAYADTTARMNDAIGGTPSAPAPTRNVLTPAMEANDRYRSAMDDYIASLTPSDRLSGLEKRYDNLSESIRSGISRQEEDAIPLEFIAGRQREIERRGNELLMPLEAELRRTMSAEEARSTALKTRTDFERLLLEDAQQQEKDALEANKRDPFELSEGQSRYEYNPETGRYEEIASKAKTYAPKTGGVGGSGTLTGIAAEVMKNPALFSTLTPTVKGQVLSQLAGSGFDTTALTIPNLNAGQRESISKFDTLLREAANVMTDLGDQNFGPIASRAKGAASVFGFAPNYTRMNSIISDLNSILVQLRSGSAVTPSEFERIKGFIPSINDDETTIETKISRFIEETRMARENYIENATLSPYQISQGGGSTAQGGSYDDYLKAIGQ